MTNEIAIKLLNEIRKFAILRDGEIVALEMAIKALETIPKYKNAYNKGYEAGVKATNVDFGVVWEERIDAIREEILALNNLDYVKPVSVEEIMAIIDKHCGGENE